MHYTLIDPRYGVSRQAAAENKALSSALESGAVTVDEYGRNVSGLADVETQAGANAAQMAGKLDQAASAAVRLGNSAATAGAQLRNMALATADSYDKVGAETRKLETDGARLASALDRAYRDHDADAIIRLTAAQRQYNEAVQQNDQRKNDPSGRSRDLGQQTEEANRLVGDNTSLTESARIQAQIANEKKLAANTQATTEERAQAELKLADLQKQLYDQQSKAGTKASKDVLGAARQSIQQEIQLAEESARKKTKGADDDLTHHRASPTAYLTEVKAALNEEIAAVQAAYAKELALAGLTQSQKAAFRREEALTVAKINDQIVADERKAADDALNQWKKVGDGIAGLMNSQVDGLLRGTTSVQQAFRNMAESAIEDLVKLGIKLAAEAVVMDAMNLITGGGFSGVGSLLGGLGLPSFDVGAWNLPHDTLAMVHQNELIMPAAEAGAFHNMLSNGDDTYHTHNYNIVSHAADPRDIARQVAALWTSNPSMRPAY